MVTEPVLHESYIVLALIPLLPFLGFLVNAFFGKRLQANPQRQRAFRQSLAKISGGLDARTARRLEAVVQLLFSATAWQTMRDYWGFTGREAGEAAAWAIDIVINEARKQAKAKGRNK